jgi:hypothetical protein
MLAQMAQMPGQAKIATGLFARGAFGARTDLACESAMAREHDFVFYILGHLRLRLDNLDNMHI